MADTTDHILNESIDTLEFYETVSSWKENSPDAALWSDVIDKINEYAKREVAAALASRPAEVDDEGLPPLPKHSDRFNVNGPDGHRVKGYTAEQYRQGQRDAVAADRARMPDADEISDAITEAYNMACLHKDWEAKKCWRELGDKFSEWSGPSHTTNK